MNKEPIQPTGPATPPQQPAEPASAVPRSTSQQLRSIGLSMLVHVVLLVVAALVVTQSTPRGTVDGDRPAGLVLAKVDPQQKVEFLEQNDVNPNPDETAEVTDADLQQALPDTPPQVDLENLTDLANPLDVDQQVFDSGSAIQVPGNSTARPQQNLTAEQLRELEAERQRLAASQPKGTPVGVNPFGLQSAEGRRFLFVLDRSKSMGDQGLGVLTQAATQLEQALAELDENHQFQIVAYHHDVELMGERRLLSGSAANKRLVSDFVLGLAAFGGTEHEKALISALGFRPDVVVLLTDGGYPKLNSTQLGTIERICRGSGTQVNCIQFGSGPLQKSDNFMANLAKDNQGQYLYIDVNQWKK